MGGGGGTQESKTTTQIDPNILPYVTYGLEEGKRLYESGTPSFFPGKTYVEPSEATTRALGLAEQRALAGSPLTQAAQQQTLATIQGQGVNPFLAGALEQANRLAGEQYTRNIQNLQAQANVKYLTFSSHRRGWDRRAAAYGFRPKQWICEV